MPTVIIDEQFTGLTAEQSKQIALSARKCSRGSQKSRKRKRARIPTCTIGDETFPIKRVYSTGLQHKVQRYDGEGWQLLTSTAVIRWHAWGATPGTESESPTSSAPTYLPKDQQVQRMMAVHQLVEQAQSLMRDAAQKLWGVSDVDGPRDRLANMHRNSAQVLSELQCTLKAITVAEEKPTALLT